MSSANPAADELHALPAKHPAPIITPSRVFNVAGWVILALLVYFLVIPAIRFGNCGDYVNDKTERREENQPTHTMPARLHLDNLC